MEKREKRKVLLQHEAKQRFVRFISGSMSRNDRIRTLAKETGLDVDASDEAWLSTMCDRLGTIMSPADLERVTMFGKGSGDPMALDPYWPIILKHVR